MKVSKKYLKRYCIFCFVLFFLFLLLLISSLYFQKPLFTFLIGVLLYYPLVLYVKWFSYKNFFQILSREHNSQEFYDAIHQRPLNPSLIYRLHAEWYVGNYEELILLSQAGYTTAKSLQKKCTCLVFLARAYFELHNKDKLKQITDTFYELKKMNPMKEKLFSNYKIFFFYQSFINENYSSCMDYIDEQLMHLNIRKQEDNLRWLTQQINRAICYYWQGDKQKAKELFEYFKQNTPNLKNFTDLAMKYLSAIECNNSSALNTEMYDDVNTYDVECQIFALKKQLKKKKSIFFVLLIAFLGLLMSFEIIDYIHEGDSQSKYLNEVIEYENDLNNAIDRNYDNGKFIKYFDVRNGEQHIDTFCLIEVGGKLDLASIVTYDGGKTLELLMLVKDIRIPYDYCLKSAISDHQITISISDKYLSDSNYIEVIEFSSGNTSYWLGVRSISMLM